MTEYFSLRKPHQPLGTLMEEWLEEQNPLNWMQRMITGGPVRRHPDAVHNAAAKSALRRADQKPRKQV